MRSRKRSKYADSHVDSASYVHPYLDIDPVVELEAALNADLESNADLDLLLSKVHGIRGWACLPADDIADILDMVLRKSPPARRNVRGRYKVECCPNCGCPVKLLRAIHLMLRKRSAAFGQMKPPSPYICRRCGLDLRRVKIIK